MSHSTNQHPEGLPFEPTGPGWTTFDEPRGSLPTNRLLTERNIVSVRTNHPDEWTTTMAEVNAILPPPKRNRRTGALENGMSTDEQERLALLSMLVARGVVQETLPPKAPS